MTDVDPVAIIDPPRQVNVPYRELSLSEWQSVPRTIPTWVIFLSTWLPKAALILYIFVLSETQPSTELRAEWIARAGAAALVFAGLAAGRMAPWCAALISAMFLYAAGGFDSVHSPILETAILFFILLGLVANLSGARFCRQLRQWRQTASQSLTVAETELGRTSARKEVSPLLLRLASAAVAFGVLKTAFNFFGDANRRLDQIDPERIDTILYGSVGVLLWVILWLIRVAVRQYVGELVLRVPVGYGAGSAIRFGALTGVMLRAELAQPECECANESTQSPDEDDDFLNNFIKVNDNCPVHGIEAVNAMQPAEAARQAHQPWVFAEHVDDRLIASGATIPVLGLTGWGSRPVRLIEEHNAYSFTSQTARAHHVYPHSVGEVFNRAGRRLRWRSVSTQSLDPMVWNDSAPAGTVLDRIPLQAQRIEGQMIRVAGQRPYLAPTNP